MNGVVVICVQGRPYACGLAQRRGGCECYCQTRTCDLLGACCPSLGGSVSAPRVPSWRGRPPSRWACSSTRRRLCSLPRCLPCWPCVRDPLSEIFVVAACAGKARVRSGVRAGVRSVPWVDGVRVRCLAWRHWSRTHLSSVYFLRQVTFRGKQAYGAACCSGKWVKTVEPWPRHCACAALAFVLL